MHTNTHIITNGLDLGEDRQGKGRYFTSKFLEPGLAKYDEPIGTILLDKETIDKFITSFKGCPVIIDHKDITDETAKDERVGVVSNVWYNAEDGWYYCDGVIFDKNAQDLITHAGYTVSCAYSFNTNNMSGTWHNNPYDGKVVSGDFLHLALVPVPRYEDATIALNSKKDEQPRNPSDIVDWITIKGNHLPIRKGETKEDVISRFIDQREQTHISNQIDVLTESIERENKKLETLKQTNDKQGVEQKIQKIQDLQKRLNDLKNKQKDIPQERKLSNEDLESLTQYKKSIEFEKENKKLERQLNIEKQKENEKRRKMQEEAQLTEKYGEMKQYVDAFENAEKIQGGGYAGYSMSNRAEKAYIKGFVPISKLTKKQQNIASELGAKEWHHSSKYANRVDFYDKNLIEMIEKKASDSDLENYLEIENEYNTSAWHNYDKEDLIKWKELRDKYKVYNSINIDELDARKEKGEDMKLNQLWQLFNKKEAINKKGENEMAEKVDKRKLIDEIGGILKGKVDDELIRTIIKKAEEIGYEDSEKSADNKAKNEADEDEKKEEKADNKCAKNEGDEDKKEDKEEKAENEGEKEDEADNEDEDEEKLEEMKKAYNSSNVQVKSLYVPQSERLALGKQLF